MSNAFSPTIVVLAGGVSAEREVSLGSGRACAAALARSFPTRFVDVTEAALPRGIDRERELVFSTLHGVFGEDGQMQRLLDVAGIHYAGCGAAASALTMDKQRTKAAVSALASLPAAELGVVCPRGLCFSGAELPNAREVVAQLGERLVLKPNAEGSSVGLRLIKGECELSAAFAEIEGTVNDWLLEERIVGRELAVGVVEGLEWRGGRGAMGLVEIRPRSGVYDYESKYTPGRTEYLAPAPLDEATSAGVRAAAWRLYEACGCRDYARVDFILSDSGMLYFLEINTLPGMKATSLLPMSARCAGLDFVDLVRELVAPAVRRFREEAGRRA